MMECEECGVGLVREAGEPPISIWGVATYSRLGLKSHYFCSEQHCNMWIGEHPEYEKMFRSVIDEKDTT